MNIETLQKFCYPYESKLNISKPWSVGEYTFATDGRVMMRVPRMADVPEIDDPVDAEGVWPKAPPETWLDLPKYEITPPEDLVCPKCGGKKGAPVVCVECDGNGYVELSNEYNDYEVDCKTCNGSGFTGGCHTCNGTGKVDPPFKAVPLGHAGFQVKYLALIGELPNCQIGTIDENAPAWFRFDGGDGLLMPCSPDTYKKKETQ